MQRGRGCALAESSLWASLPGSFIPPNPGGAVPWPRSYTLGNGDTVGWGGVHTFRAVVSTVPGSKFHSLSNRHDL